jgi:hypothetical protein
VQAGLKVGRATLGEGTIAFYYKISFVLHFATTCTPLIEILNCFVCFLQGLVLARQALYHLSHIPSPPPFFLTQCLINFAFVGLKLLLPSPPE